MAHDSSIEQTYEPNYAPKTDIAIGHIEFLLKYDDIKLDLLAAVFHKLEEQELQQLIDMPDNRLSEVVMYLHQNKGVFPNRRKKQFEEITETEFEAIERIYSEIFS